MNKLTSDYINILRTSGKSIHTIRVYSKDIEKLLSYFNIENYSDLLKLSVDDFTNFYTYLLEETNLSKNSLNGLIRSLSAWFKYLRIKKIVPADYSFFDVLMGNQKYAKVNNVKKVVLTDEEVIALVEATGDNLQDKLMISLMLLTGLRRDEVANIKVSDIRDCSILIRGKGGKERYTFMTQDICEMMNQYLSSRKDFSVYVFRGNRGNTAHDKPITGETINNRIKHYARIANIETGRAIRITAHRLRGTAITQVAKEFDIYKAQAFAGHSNINTTLIYVNANDDVTKDVISGRANMFTKKD